MYVPVNAAIEREITYQRHHFKLFCIVYPYPDYIIRTVFYIVCDFKHKSAVSSSVFSQMLPVDKQVGNAVCTLETKEKSFPFPFFGYMKRFLIVAYSAYIGRIARRCILSIPCMWQVYPSAFAVLYLMTEAERPVAIQ